MCSRKFKEYNHDIKVECWKTDYKAKRIYERKISGVTFKIFPAYNIKRLGNYSPKLLRYIKKEMLKNKKVIFNIESFRHLLFYSVALKLKNYPLVVQNNGEAPAVYKATISKGIKKLYYLAQIPFEKKAFKNVDLIYILDNHIREFLPHNETVIKQQTLGVMPEIFVPLNKKAARRLLNLDPDKKYLLYVGRLNYTKRADLLIDVFNELKKERQDIELIIAGTKKDDPLYNYAREAGAKIYGLIMHTELYKYLAAADVYVLPKYTKTHSFGGIGLLPLEALLCNTPVIGGSLQNFSHDNRNAVGFAVSEKDQIKEAILKIIDGKVTFDNLREIAIKHYSWENIIRRTYNDFREILIKY
ncbi:MAG: glycosyltransferase [Candidatus Marinimicrobia bacterium]|nr:glycosyltransferase [Candidatus Neomarinimicrobiota bacterium]